MELTTPNFLFIFLPITVILFLIIRPSYRSWLLIIASMIFYGWSNQNNLYITLTIVLINYGLVWGVSKAKEHARLMGGIFYFSLALNIFIFIFYKVLPLNPWLIFNQINLNELTYPLGLSFILFQILSYLLDVYRSKDKMVAGLADYLLYILLFPKLILGPITRYRDLAGSIHSPQISLDHINQGAHRFVTGLAKKILIADQLAPLVNAGFALKSPVYSTASTWLVLAAYTLQIYYDFSGYTDMAIGVSAIFGFKLPENFNKPYWSRNLTEFWRKWHMTLTGWFREYIFSPLEFKRRRTTFLRQQQHILLIFILTGLWHGFTLNYLVWGLFNGFVLSVEMTFLSKWLKKIPPVLQHIYLMAVVTLGWVFFRSPSLVFALQFIKRLFIYRQGSILDFSQSAPLILVNNSVFGVMLIAALGILPLAQIGQKWLPENGGGEKSRLWVAVARDVALLLCLLLSLAAIATTGFTPSIYGSF